MTESRSGRPEADFPGVPGQGAGQTRRELPGLGVVAAGPPRLFSTQSGVPAGVIAALERRGITPHSIDSSLTRWQRVLAATEALVTNPRVSLSARTAFRGRLHRSRIATRARSANTATAISAATEDAVRVFLVIRGIYCPFNVPYVPYSDNTAELARRLWPPWFPWSRREHGRVVAAEAKYFANALHVFVASAHVAKSLIDDYDIPATRITVVGGGANMPVSHRASTWSARANPTVLFVGRDWERKGGDLLLTAFDRVTEVLPTARLVVVGSTPPLRRSWLEVRGRVESRKAMQAVYSNADVFCLPTRYDGYGMSFLEAMANELPCVGTDVCAVPDIISHGQTGYVVPPEDPDMLAATLITLLANPDLRRRLGVAGRERVESRLNWDQVVEQMLDAESLRSAL